MTTCRVDNCTNPTEEDGYILCPDHAVMIAQAIRGVGAALAEACRAVDSALRRTHQALITFAETAEAEDPLHAGRAMNTALLVDSRRDARRYYGFGWPAAVADAPGWTHRPDTPRHPSQWIVGCVYRNALARQPSPRPAPSATVTPDTPNPKDTGYDTRPLGGSTP